MLRRSPSRVVLVALAALAVSGCAAFDDTQVVADVDDGSIDHDDFDALADEYFASPELFGTTPAEAGHVDGDQMRFLLGALIEQEVLSALLADADVDPTDEREAYLDEMIAGGPLSELSPQFQELIADVDGQFRGQALAEVTPPDADDLRDLYADDPSLTGVACVRHILVDTEAEADDVLDELADGADFAELAAEVSTDTSTAENGGAITSGDDPCIPLVTIQQGFDPGFTAAMLDAREGVPSAPAESSFGWHVILHRPWDEIGDAVAGFHQPGDSGGFLYDGRIATADVDVDPRYGRWDAVTRTVVPVG